MLILKAMVASTPASRPTSSKRLASLLDPLPPVFRAIVPAGSLTPHFGLIRSATGRLAGRVGHRGRNGHRRGVFRSGSPQERPESGAGE